MYHITIAPFDMDLQNRVHTGLTCSHGTTGSGVNPGYEAASTLLRSRVDPSLTKVRSELRWWNEEECRTTAKYHPTGLEERNPSCCDSMA